MNTDAKVKKPAALKNVAAFAMMVEKVVDREPDLPGMAVFHGDSGLGKTKSAVYGSTMYRACYVECGQFTTAKSLMVSILRELEVSKPRGTITDMISQAVEIMAADPRRPLVVDEAHHVAAKKFVDLLRELHDKSTAPVIMIGEETLPRQLENFERVQNRILVWTAAQPCDADDLARLVKVYAPSISIAPDLADAILKQTRGNTRRIVVNLAHAVEVAASKGTKQLDLEAFGGTGGLVGIRAPARGA
jgi:DNA transposition AAA+ family ATPase